MRAHTYSYLILATCARARVCVCVRARARVRVYERYWLLISVFYRAFFNSTIDKHQHVHFFTFNTVLV